MGFLVASILQQGVLEQISLSGSFLLLVAFFPAGSTHNTANAINYSLYDCNKLAFCYLLVVCSSPKNGKASKEAQHKQKEVVPNKQAQ